MKDLISIIIPVYNVETYLSQCLDSVLGQSYHELQIIIIDDGSTDQSGSICDFYADKDNRVTCIHQKNSGAAVARNNGLKIATGEYLAFVDSDDYLEEDAYSYMLELLLKYDADVIQCSFERIFPDRTVEYLAEQEIVEYTSREYLKKLTKDWTCSLLWNKLYKKKLFDDIWFKEGHQIDDEFFTYRGMMNANKIIRSPKIVYHYSYRAGSIMQNSTTKQVRISDKLAYLNERRQNIISTFPELKQDFDYHYIHMLAILAQSKDTSLENIVAIQDAVRNYFDSVEHCKMEFSLKRKLRWIMHSKPERIFKNNHKLLPKR